MIDIGASAKKHAIIVPQLLAARGLTGCDTVVYMFGVGKTTVLKVLLAGKKNLDKLGDPVAIVEMLFVGARYGNKTQESISKVRYHIWAKSTSSRKITKSLPPTSESLAENIKRAHIQTSIWKAAMKQDSPRLDPTDFGWSKDEVMKSLSPVTMPTNTAAAPKEVLQMIRCGYSTYLPCSIAKCGCVTDQLPCTVFCNSF